MNFKYFAVCSQDKRNFYYLKMKNVWRFFKKNHSFFKGMKLHRSGVYRVENIRMYRVTKISYSYA